MSTNEPAPGVSRREALVALLALSGFALTAGCGSRGFESTLEALVLPAQALAEAAKAYVDELGEPDLDQLTVEVLGEPLRGTPTEAQVAAFKAGLTRRIRADFGAGATLRLGGWDVSHTEAHVWTWLHQQRQG